MLVPVGVDAAHESKATFCKAVVSLANADAALQESCVVHVWACVQEADCLLCSSWLHVSI